MISNKNIQHWIEIIAMPKYAQAELKNQVPRSRYKGVVYIYLKFQIRIKYKMNENYHNLLYYTQTQIYVFSSSFMTRLIII